MPSGGTCLTAPVLYTSVQTESLAGFPPTLVSEFSTNQKKKNASAMTVQSRQCLSGKSVSFKPLAMAAVGHSITELSMAKSSLKARCHAWLSITQYHPYLYVDTYMM